MATQEHGVQNSIARRHDALSHSWKTVFELERARIGDAAGACRHCLVATCDKLKELIEGSQQEQLQMTEFWKDEVRQCVAPHGRR